MLQPDQMRIEEKRLLQISNTVINLEMDTQLASSFFHRRKGRSAELLYDRIYLHL